MRVEIWSDVVCPWCYVGKRRFEAALARFAHRDAVRVQWRSFELDPSAPAERTEDPATHLARKYGMSRAQAEQAQARVTEVAKAEGLAFDLAGARSGNTFDAHRLIHLAAEHGLQGEAKERLLRAYFVERRPIGQRATLLSLAGEVGLDVDEATAALAGDAFAEAVRADEREAARIGVSGVPFFLLDRRYAISGAQPVEVALRALERAWADASAAAAPETGGSGACDDGSCAV
jgi:predicted DsbA family dithiol-disulfide isomerase